MTHQTWQLGPDPSSGTPITAYHIDNGHGLTLTATTFGATLLAVQHDGCNQIIGFLDPQHNGTAPPADTVTDICTPGSYIGSTVGRVANRIKSGEVTIDGTRYELSKNFLSHHTLHGGFRGLSYINAWEGSIERNGNSIAVRFHHTSPDGAEGFPGTLETTVTYRLTPDNCLCIEFHALSNRPTPVNLTNHTYWNLAGAGRVDTNHLLYINADRRLTSPAPDGIFEGTITEVENTPHDFRTLRAPLVPGTADAPETPAPAAYDTAYHLNGTASQSHYTPPVTSARPDLPVAAYVQLADSSRAMLVSSTYPSMQLYLPGALPVPPVPGGYVNYGALCLECQLHTDAHRFPDLPTTILPPGTPYRHTTCHQFYRAGDIGSK